MKVRVAAIFIATAMSALAGDPSRTYPSGFSVVLDRGDELYQVLPPKLSDKLAEKPIALQPQDVPRIMPITSVDNNKVLRQISISSGFVDLVNRLCHAKAIDRVESGFFDQYVHNLAQAAGDDFAVRPPPIVDDRFWKDEVINEQQGYFNQMIGWMEAINLSHHCLGHFDKYGPKMAGPGNKTIPINDLLSLAEWEATVKFAATDALHCNLATDGPRALFDAIDKMPKRPSWSEVIVPTNVDLKQLNKELVQYEADFFHGKLDFSMVNKFQFGPGRNQSPLICLAQEPLNGGPALLAIIQRPMIDIHAYELVGQLPAHVPSVLHGMGHGLGSVVQTELNAAGQNP